MKRNRRERWSIGAMWLKAVAALAPLFVAACAREVALAPPEIRYGEDVCAECGMIVSDDRFAAALIRESDGGHQSLLFDDIGCLFINRRDEAAQLALAEFVRAADGSGWIDMPDGFYVHNREVQTPMAFGIAAFSSREAATRQRDDRGGTLFDYEELRRWVAEDARALDPFGVFSTNDAGADDSPGVDSD
jgi:copper chaperone NosL